MGVRESKLGEYLACDRGLKFKYYFWFNGSLDQGSLFGFYYTWYF